MTEQGTLSQRQSPPADDRSQSRMYTLGKVCWKVTLPCIDSGKKGVCCGPRLVPPA